MIHCEKCGVDFDPALRDTDCPHRWQAIGPDSFPGTDEGSHYMAQTSTDGFRGDDSVGPGGDANAPIDPEAYEEPPQSLQSVGSAMIANERNYQIAKGYTATHDAIYRDKSLAEAARQIVSVVCGVSVQDDGTWVPGCVGRMIKKYPGNNIKLLAIAGAFIAAEIDRLLPAADEGAEPPNLDEKADFEPAILRNASEDSKPKQGVKHIRFEGTIQRGAGPEWNFDNVIKQPVETCDAFAREFVTRTHRNGSEELSEAIQEVVFPLVQMVDDMRRAASILRNASEDSTPKEFPPGVKHIRFEGTLYRGASQVPPLAHCAKCNTIYNYLECNTQCPHERWPIADDSSLKKLEKRVSALESRMDAGESYEREQNEL